MSEIDAETKTRTFFKSVQSGHFFKTMEMVAIEVPELETEDGSIAVVYGKPISGKAGLALGRSKDEEMDLRLSRIVGQSIFTEDGERIFTDEQADHLAELVSAHVFNRLAAGVGAINKLKEKGEEGEGDANADPNAPVESPEKKD